MRSTSLAWWAFLGSLATFVGLVGAMVWTSREASGEAKPALMVFAAEALRLPLTTIAEEYEKETGQHVRLQFGPSQTILTNMLLLKKGDLFLPADDSFIKQAHEQGVLDSTQPLAKMQAVLAVKAELADKVLAFADVVAEGRKIGLANPESAAISRLLKKHWLALGIWAQLEKRNPKYLGNVNDVGNAANFGTVDVGVVWDTTAKTLPNVSVVRLPELDGVVAQVKIGITKFTEQPAEARRLVGYIRGKDQGARHFRDMGFSNVDEIDLAKTKPIVLYAGAMLRPAIEETLDEFEKKEGIAVSRVYNGCGILVSQMKAGGRPDLFFACDARFFDDVRDNFGSPDVVSRNQLVIVVPKGNPAQIESLRDLGKPNLRVGVGHEQQCALGAITKETFLRTGLYGQVMKNVKVQSPTGDLLVNQIRTGSLDVVVAYQSNITPFASELEGIPVTGIPCALPEQPLAVHKDSDQQDVGDRLMRALRSAESRQRFEKLGFRWQP